MYAGIYDLYPALWLGRSDNASEAISHGGRLHPVRKFDDKCQIPSMQNLVTGIYHRLQWLGNVCRMKDNRVSIRALFGRTDGRTSGGRSSMTWTGFVRGDLRYRSDLHGVFGHTLIEGR